MQRLKVNDLCLIFDSVQVFDYFQIEAGQAAEPLAGAQHPPFMDADVAQTLGANHVSA